MNRIFGMVMAAGLVLGPASVADAQVSLSIGNPYNGSGIQVGQVVMAMDWAGGHDLLWVGLLELRGSGHNVLFHGHLRPPAVRLCPPVYGVAPPVVVPYRPMVTDYGYRRGGFGVPFLGRRW